MKKVLMIIALNFWWNIPIKSKNFISGNFIPSREQIEKNLRKFYREEVMNKQKEYMIEKPNMLDLFSGVSLTCRKELIKGTYTFGVGFNFMHLLSFYKAKRKYNFRKSRINTKAARKFSEHIDVLLLILEELEKKVFAYNKCVKIFRLKQQLFKIEQDSYKEGEIKPSEFLKKKIIFEHDKLRLEKMEFDLKRFKNKLLINSKGSLLVTKIPLVSLTHNTYKNDYEETTFKEGERRDID